MAVILVFCVSSGFLFASGSLLAPPGCRESIYQKIKNKIGQKADQLLANSIKYALLTKIAALPIKSIMDKAQEAVGVIEAKKLYRYMGKNYHDGKEIPSEDTLKFQTFRLSSENQSMEEIAKIFLDGTIKNRSEKMIDVVKINNSDQPYSFLSIGGIHCAGESRLFSLFKNLGIIKGSVEYISNLHTHPEGFSPSPDDFSDDNIDEYLLGFDERDECVLVNYFSVDCPKLGGGGVENFVRVVSRGEEAVVKAVVKILEGKSFERIIEELSAVNMYVEEDYFVRFSHTGYGHLYPVDHIYFNKNYGRALQKWVELDINRGALHSACRHLISSL